MDKCNGEEGTIMDKFNEREVSNGQVQWEEVTIMDKCNGEEGTIMDKFNEREVSNGQVQWEEVTIMDKYNEWKVQ